MMPKKLTTAERQKLYRQRRDADPERRAAYLVKKRAKYQQDVERGKRKPVKDMKDRELRKQRKEWRRNQQRCRQHKQNSTVVDVFLENETR